MPHNFAPPDHSNTSTPGNATMAQSHTEYPKWVVDLNNPPLPKPKTSGIVDPPGFLSQAPSTSKVNSCATHRPGLCLDNTLF